MNAARQSNGCLLVDSWSYPSGQKLWDAAGLQRVPGLLMRHRCDDRHCIERTHLTPGNKADNRRDDFKRLVLILLDGRILFALRWKVTRLVRWGFAERVSLGIAMETRRGARRARRLAAHATSRAQSFNRWMSRRFTPQAVSL